MPSNGPLDVDDVVLVRLLVRPKSFSTRALSSSLLSLFRIEDEATAMALAEASLAHLKKTGHIWSDTKLVLTEKGEAAALDRLGIPGMPQHQKTDWAWAKGILLVQRRRLGAGMADVRRTDQLAAWLVFTKEKLQIDTPPTAKAIVRALACRALGLPDKGPLRKNMALGGLLDVTRPESSQSAQPAHAEEFAPSVAAPLKTPRPKRPSKAPGATADDLRAFADTINQLALSAKTGKWIGDKVYVAQVWRDFKPERGAEKPALDVFKKRLVAAARAGHILLSRADLVGAYPPQALEESRIEVGGQDYHFIETAHLR